MTDSVPRRTAGNSLPTRLSGLRRPMPADVVGRARAAVLSGNGSKDRAIARRIRMRRGMVAGVAAAVLGANAVAAYFVPVYAGVIGKVPGVASILSLTGLSAADVTAISVTDQHDGVQLSVVAGYADENGTVLTVSIARPGYAPGASGDWSLRDQFGHQYDAHVGSFGDKSTTASTSNGPTSGFMSFAPITGPAEAAGARLTLQMDDWHDFPAGGGVTSTPASSVHGTWRVTFALIRHPATHVSWSPATIGGLYYRFPNITITASKLVEIEWTASGPPVARLLAPTNALPLNGGAGAGCPRTCPAATPPNPVEGLRSTWPELLDATGHVVEQTPFIGDVFSAEGDRESGTLQYVLAAGHYQLVVHAANGPSLQRMLTVP